MSLYFDSGANRSLSNLDAEGEEKFTDKQDTLVSGENIKTINGVSVLGEGNIEVGEGGTITVNQTYDPTSSYAQSGTAVYDALTNSMEAVSQNGTISNCILEIPQNLKLTLENNVLTLKSGSIVTKSGTTYETITSSSDKTTTFTQTDGEYLVFTRPTDLAISVFNKNNCVSGTTDSIAEGVPHIWFKTDDKEVRQYYVGSGYWVRNYPLCLIQISNGVASFAKDSNGNDMIFNGAGYIGHHAVVYPNVKSFRPNKKDSSGKLQSNNNKTNAVIILELNTNTNMVTISGNSQGVTRKYKEVDIFNPSDTSYFQYVKSENADYFYSGSGWAQRSETPLIEYNYDGTTVTDFTICQPVRLATTEMLDKVQSQVDTNTSDIAGKQDDVTTLTGYDSTQTQTLKNINGVLTWVTD